METLTAKKAHHLQRDTQIFDVIKKISREGVTILLIEQNAKLALEASTRGYVLDSGRITLCDSTAALLGNPQVRHAYLGE